MTQYGNEYKKRLEHHFSRSMAENIGFIFSGMQPIIRNVSLWKIARPWQVPERKIDDILIWIVKEGIFRCTVNGKTVLLEPGKGCIVPEYMSHSFEFEESCDSGEVFILHLHIRMLSEENFSAVLRSEFFTVPHPESVFEALERAIALFFFSRETALFCAGVPVYELLFTLAEKGMICRDGTNKSDLRIQKALEFIRLNYMQNIDIVDIASAVNLHEVQFRKLFKEQTGLTPHLYLNRVRLHHAVELLSHTTQPIHAIARQTGFNSESYFCLVFRKHYGVSPEKYRKTSLYL